MTDKTATDANPSRTRRVRVTFTGFERFWMQVLVEGLSSRFSDDLDCRWVEWPSTWAQRARLVFAMLRSDVVVRVGMPFEYRSETNKVWLHWIARSRRVRGVNYWIGFDAHVFAARVAASDLTADDRLAIAALSHFASAGNVAERLLARGVPAITVTVPSPDQKVPDPPPPIPEVLRVLLYWGDSRWEYSGGPQLVEAARRLQDLRFEVVGAIGRDVENPPRNMAFHGRVSDMSAMYARCAVVVRMVGWDAVPGAMVEEGMLYARHVIYSFEFPHATFVAYGDTEGLVAALTEMRGRFERGELGLDLAAREFMIQAWEPEPRWAAMHEALLRVEQEGRVERRAG